jgi:hypothetical protein
VRKLRRFGARRDNLSPRTPSPPRVTTLEIGMALQYNFPLNTITPPTMISREYVVSFPFDW